MNNEQLSRAPERSETPADEAVAEGLDILESLIANIKKGGLYSEEATLTFLDQIRQCFAVAPTVSSSAAPSDDVPESVLDLLKSGDLEPILMRAGEEDLRLTLYRARQAMLATPSVQAVAAAVAGVTNAARVKNTLVINGSKDQVAASPVELTDAIPEWERSVPLCPFDSEIISAMEEEIKAYRARHLTAGKASGDTAAQGGK